MHLMSRFRIMMTQTRQFPTMLVMRSMDNNVAIAGCDSDITEERRRYSLNLNK